MSRITYPLIEELPGIGKKRASYLHKLNLNNAYDVMNLFPMRYIDRRNSVTIDNIRDGEPCVLRGVICNPEQKLTFKKRISIFTADIIDSSGSVSIVWFNARGLDHIVKEGTSVVLYGIPIFKSDKIEITNPEFVVIKNDKDVETFCSIIPVYPSTAGISAKWYRNFVKNTLQSYLYFVTETLPKNIIEKHNFPSLRDALKSMHMPCDFSQIERAEERFKYEEFFRFQCLVQLRKKTMGECGSSFPITPGDNVKKFMSILPFRLTNEQQKVIGEIMRDFTQNVPMARLLQGDVGSGKTIVAITAVIAATDCNVQSAIMAPTEVLAEQLFHEVEKYLSICGVETVFLRGSMSAGERSLALNKLKSGKALVAVGTQALLTNTVVFKNLGLVIIDEQHRFGVRQREELLRRTETPHVLLMSATPIPRTLSLTLFADLSISILKKKPANIKKRVTRIAPVEQMGTLLQFLIDEIANGGQVYWICPRVEEDDESSSLPSVSVEKRYKYLNKQLGQLGVGIIHGKMRSEEKKKNMERFQKGIDKIIVGTTVLEVGINVPKASVIVIECPELYGLSQLHQLRGRVGRGNRRGVCLLLTYNALSLSQRLQIICETEDGFKIAEEDLKIRGTGKMFGTDQHGESDFRLADPIKDYRILLVAAKDAEELVASLDEHSENKDFLRILRLSSVLAN